ncbi:DUF3891 family protein [Botrimarina mediterranea]|uniref:DUF3891 family protein n=1 Tax=Botrimarina mediterranea TaxID=2528022 RepID=UPI001188127C|nr:hypothetical protein K2D_44390 [Planctomycetes bacterium K2D]
MIRRACPLGAPTPERWLLVLQPDHARLSYELAKAWGGTAVAPLVCADEDMGDPLAGVRAEVLEAIRRHDDGWIGYQPLLDAETGLPLSFTEMPADASQAIWNGSIDACRAVGLLAGWMAASHFYALQTKHDADDAVWAAWRRDVERRRETWLAEWLASSSLHTTALAERCLAWLQSFDWMSLWLCCVCPAKPDDALPEPLVVGDEATAWPPMQFAPGASSADFVRVTPWPFAPEQLDLRVEARVFDPQGTGDAVTSLAWRLAPGVSRARCSPTG